MGQHRRRTFCGSVRKFLGGKALIDSEASTAPNSYSVPNLLPGDAEISACILSTDSQKHFLFARAHTHILHIYWVNPQTNTVCATQNTQKHSRLIRLYLMHTDLAPFFVCFWNLEFCSSSTKNIFDSQPAPKKLIAFLLRPHQFCACVIKKKIPVDVLIKKATCLLSS